MERILAKHLSQYIGKHVRIRGWLHNSRNLGKLNFVIVRDRSGLIQVVIEDKEVFRPLKPLFPGSVVTVEGEVKGSTQAELGCEIVSPRVTVVSPVTEPPPLEYYKPEFSAELETVLDHRPIALRNQKIAAVFAIQATIAHAYQVFMHDTVGATAYYGPNLIGASSEGGAEFFNVDYFGHPATLAQSSQLYKQMLVGVYERVYAIMPFFRAENSNTARHLTEGKQFEFEMGYFDSWHEIMDIEEATIKFIVEQVRQKNARELALLGNPLVSVPQDKPFPRLTFAEAQELFFQRTGIDERTEPDLSPAAERDLCKYALETHGTSCLFVTDWKASKRPFYSYPKDENPELTNTFDLLCAGTEITSGGQRRHTYEAMVEGLRLKGMNPDSFGDYLSIFKFGMPPHGGFGLGLERLTMTLLQLENVREASLFPSDPKRIAGNRIKAKIFTGAENIRNEIVRRLRESEAETAPPLGTAVAVKAIIARTKSSKRNVIAVLRADQKIDFKTLSEAVGERCEFESPEVVSERFGLNVTFTPPFGNLLGAPTFIDSGLLSESQLAIQSGKEGELFGISADLLVKLVEAQAISLAKKD